MPNRPMRIVTPAYAMRGTQNAISVNVRDRPGGLRCNYGMGGGTCVIANCEGSIDRPMPLSLHYRLEYPLSL